MSDGSHRGADGCIAAGSFRRHGFFGRVGLWSLALCLLGCCFLAYPGAAAPVPSPPAQFIQDDAGVLPADLRSRLNDQLAQFERDTSSQVVVYVARALPSDEELNRFVNRIFRAWGIGKRKRTMVSYWQFS